MAKLTGAELLAIQAEYLKREIVQHERDIISNQGKVQENKELLERIQTTCLYCGDRAYVAMEKHIQDRHAEELREAPELPPVTFAELG